MDDGALLELAARLGGALKGRGLTLASAESCTGGWIGQAVTAVSGSSEWYDRGFIAYSNDAKRELLGVAAQTLERQGAVSEAVVREMVRGALAKSRARVAVAVSGVAGPSGGTASKPVGTVCLAWAGEGLETVAVTRHFAGDREAVRRQAVAAALEGVFELVRGGKPQ